MRALLLTATLLGATAMGETAVAQERKDPLKAESYDEKVAIRRFLNGRLITGVAKDVPAFRFEQKGALRFYTRAETAALPTVGTEITDKDGTVYVVEKVVEGGGVGFHLSTVKPKPKDE